MSVTLLVISLLVVCVFLFSGCAGSGKAKANATNTTIAPPECKRMDADLALNISGYVSLGTVISKDVCKDGSNLREYYCEGGKVANRVVPCPGGTVCEGGICIEKGAAAPPQEEEAHPLPCIDTDDGKDYYLSGVAMTLDANYSDKCLGSYDLTEYYCQGSSVMAENHKCLVGEQCKDGSCFVFAKNCTDTNVNDTSLAGTVTLSGGGQVIDTKTDNCTGDTTKIDYYCSNNSVRNMSVSCPSDKYCYQGACVLFCDDMDGGKNYANASQVKDRYGSYSDYCRDSKTIVEYYCDKNLASPYEIDCPDFCNKGRCIDESEVICKEASAGRTVRLQYGSDILEEHNDTCEDYRTMRDYECISEDIEYSTDECLDDQFCYAGACKDITAVGCYDLDLSDPLGPEYVKSYVVLTYNDSIKSVKEDACYNDEEVTEYYCSGDSVKVDYIDCNDEEKCQDGRCVYPYTCKESDGGISLIPGTSSLYEDNRLVRTERDACFSDHSVWETYCAADGHIAYAELPCPSGQSCDPANGSCN